MIFELGQLGGLIHVTAQYSNAVLVAMLPQVSDVAKKLELPVPQPVTQQQVIASSVTPYFDWRGEMAGWGVTINGGWTFGFHGGHFDSFESPHSYFVLQDPDEIPKFVGTVSMTKDEAVQMARETLKKLGLSLESVFAEQEPRVTLPPKTRTGIVPRYRVEWLNPRVGSASQNGSSSVKIEVNADAKRVEQIVISPNASLRRPWPKIGVEPVYRSRTSSVVNPKYARALVPIVLRAIDEYGKTLGLPILRPLTTNQVTRFRLQDNLGRPHCEVELTNGWRFIFRDNMVNGFYAPDNLFNSDQRPILIKDFVGKWNMTEAEAIELIRRTLAKLNYPTNLVRVDFPPKTSKPIVPGIPRYSFWWWCENETHDDLVSKVEAEVDADKREMKSLYFENRAFWRERPPIDAPISLPQPAETNAAPTKTSGKSPRPLNLQLDHSRCSIQHSNGKGFRCRKKANAQTCFSFQRPVSPAHLNFVDAVRIADSLFAARSNFLLQSLVVSLPWKRTEDAGLPFRAGRSPIPHCGMNFVLARSHYSNQDTPENSPGRSSATNCGGNSVIRA